ncbi:MAG TPA: hypothetical protein VGG17_01535 [Acidimicrobiales bacterium]
MPWWSIAWSFLGSAVKERVTQKPSLRVGSALAAITISIAAVPLALFASLTPAGASSTVTVVIAKTGNASRQLESAFAAHHFNIAVAERPVSTGLVGSILSIRTADASSHNANAISELRGQCKDGGSGCVDGLVIPLHYSGTARVTVGAAMTSYATLNEASTSRKKGS